MASYYLDQLVDNRLDIIRNNSAVKREAITDLINNHHSDFMVDSIDCDLFCSVLVDVINGRKISNDVVNRLMDDVLDSMEDQLADDIAYDILNNDRKVGIIKDVA